MSEYDKPGLRRVLRRPEMPANAQTPWWSVRPAAVWTTFKSYCGLGREAQVEPIDSREALGQFLDKRASFVAQISLYGYLRTRAGMRYPELFDDDPFVESINIAKWHLWLDCLSDLAVFAGSCLAQQAPREVPRLAAMIVAVVEEILARTGTPAEAGGEFSAHAARVRSRIARTDWSTVGSDEAAFTESPAGLVRWAPIVDELKALDDEIVRNSVRFRWQQVRREFVQHLDLPAMLEAASRRL